MTRVMRTSLVLFHVHGCARAQVDLDGDADLVVTTWGFGNTLYLNDGNGNFSSRLALHDGDLYSTGVTIGDLNADGLPDILILSATSTNIVLSNAGGASFVSVDAAAIGMPEEYHSLEASLGDMDGDGDLECAPPPNPSPPAIALCLAPLRSALRRRAQCCAPPRASIFFPTKRLLASCFYPVRRFFLGALRSFSSNRAYVHASFLQHSHRQ